MEKHKRTHLRVIRDPTRIPDDTMPDKSGGVGLTVGEIANRLAVETYAEKTRLKRARARETRRKQKRPKKPP